MIRLLLICLFYSSTALADLGDELDDMLGTGWGTYTTTPAASLSPDDVAGFNRVAYSFASLRVRNPVKNFNLISFSAPQLNYGCSGIDIVLGSFSLISKTELISMFRSIASNALSYGFGQAIHAMCPPCWSGMKSLQEDIQRLNAMARNSCEVAKSLVGDKGSNLGKSICTTMASFVDDYAACAEGPDAADDAFSNMYSDFKTNILGMGGDPDSHFVAGNLVTELHARLGVASNILDEQVINQIFGQKAGVPYTIEEIATSLLGTVLHIPDADEPISGEVIPPLVDFSKLIDSEVSTVCGNGACQQMYTCSEMKGHTCGKLTQVPVVHDGVTNTQIPFINRASEQFRTLFEYMTDADTVFDPSTLNPFQATIIKYIPAPVSRGLLLAGTDTSMQLALKELDGVYGRYMGYRLAESFLSNFIAMERSVFNKAVTDIKNVGDHISEVNSRLDELDKLAKSYRDKADKLMAELNEKEAYRKAYALFSTSVMENMAAIALGGRQ